MYRDFETHTVGQPHCNTSLQNADEDDVTPREGRMAG